MTETCDVLVVGAGPVGLTAALLLERAGIKAVLVEKRPAPIGHPAGHVLNPRSLEIWRQIDPSLEAQIRNDSAPIEDLRYIIWCVSLAGPELARIRAVPGSAEELAERLAQSPSRHAHYPQNRLEACLWKRAQALPNVRFLAGHTLDDLKIGDDGVTAQLEGPDGRRSLRARYCIAADGARSTIREQLGIAMPGPVLMRLASIHFRANLDRLIRGRPAVIYWIYNPKIVGPLIRHIGDEWILMTVLHPPQDPEQFTETYWRELISEALGTRAVDVKVGAIGSWSMTAQVAERFRQGPVFLTGDAAHRFPPTGGYGINTGVQDVHNLVWKLKAVLEGRAGDALLESYESERKPVAEKNCQRSLDNQAEMDSINETVALRTGDIQKAHRAMESKLFKMLSKKRQLKIVDDMQRIGLKPIRWLQDAGPKGRRLRAKLREAASHQQAHFGGAHGVELGYRYNGALTLEAPFAASELSPSDLEYRPSTVPGVYLPHVWLERDGQPLSSLDLLDYGAMQLIVDPAWQSDWAEAASAVNGALRYPLRLLAIGEGEGAAASPACAAWAMQRGVDSSGAILVRPDGHVAWRTHSLPANPAAELAAVLKRLDAAFG